MYGFYRTACAVPLTRVADVDFNTRGIIACARRAADGGAGVIVFPELAVTSYTCGDLFHQEILLRAAMNAVQAIAREFADTGIVMAVGTPVRFRSKLYNCAALIQNGEIAGFTPKTFIPNQREFYEKRHFSSGADVLALEGKPCAVDYLEKPVPFTNRFSAGNGLEIGVELCEDLWSPAPPSRDLAASGANVILNLSASNALVGKSQYRRDLVRMQSATCVCAYIYASAGVGESTTDTVFGGHSIIAENGAIIAENRRFQRENDIIFGDIDIQKLDFLRLSEGDFQYFDAKKDSPVELLAVPDIPKPVYRAIDPRPFVPSDELRRNDVCTEIFNIQCAALAKRIEASRSQKAVIGISGGLDSTLALLVTAETFKLLKKAPSDIVAVTMPGFGTTTRTLGNSKSLSTLLGADAREIDITTACMTHFSDIGHDPSVLDVTYENTQARERTQILMDTANREGGLVIGTGDLSEIALGWSTYNADHMSMYAVNCGVPKTLVRHIVSWYADKSGGELGDVLRDVVNTPVSPELLPAGKDGKIAQKTESILGSYELHDFYLYHFVKYGAEPAKIRCLAKCAFGSKYPDEEIDRTLALFIRRFFTQQFKRSCIPDGPKVGTIALSPRADWRMPSDASCELWLKNLDKASH